MKDIRPIGINSVIDGRSDLKKNGFFHRKSQEKKAKKSAIRIKRSRKCWKNMPEFSPVFVQKIFCFVQIPESFVQKHETTAEEAEGNTKENFPRHRVIVRSETEKWWNFMRKRVKSPLLCRKLLRNPSKRIKTSTPQLDREGLFLPVQAPFKKKNTCFCPPRPSPIISSLLLSEITTPLTTINIFLSTW